MAPAAAVTAVPGAEVDAAVRRAGAANALLGLAPDDGGVPAHRLCAPAGDAAALIDAVGGWLGATERRVAASMVVLGYAARLVGPSVAVLLRDGILLDLRPARVRYSYDTTHGFRLRAPEPAGWRGPPAALRDRYCSSIVEDHLGSVVAAVRAVVPVASGLLWGNVASGLTGALRTLAATGAVPLAECHGAGLALLGRGSLRGTGRFWIAGGELHFLRRSCCLFYRLEGGGTCGDCPLSRQS